MTGDELEITAKHQFRCLELMIKNYAKACTASYLSLLRPFEASDEPHVNKTASDWKNLH